MKTIWKYQLEIEDEQIVKMPSFTTILSVQVQHGVPCLWALVDSESELMDYLIVSCGTGQPLSLSNDFKYIGTYQLIEGNFVGHVFWKKVQ